MQPKHIVAEDGSWEKWVFNGNLQREDGPAFIKYEGGVVIEEIWSLNGIHREGGPAYIKYEDGVVVREEWWLNGKRHRVDGPAVIGYKDGQTFFEEWWVNSKLQREGSPAIIGYKVVEREGSPYRRFYLYRDGRQT